MTDRRSHLDGIAIGLMLACCILWGLQQVVVKVTLPVLPPFVQGAARSASAALLLWAWSFSRGIPLFRAMQFWGAYRGYAHQGPLTRELRERFYYPRGLNRATAPRPLRAAVNYRAILDEAA